MTEKDKDFLEGLAISAACHVLPARKVFREPIAYSYNGTILPVLPELEHPFAEIHSKTFVGVVYYYLLVSDVKGIKNNTVDALEFYSANIIDYEPNGSVWKIDDVWNQDYVALYDSLIWSNYDILDESGNLILAASDPIPVYDE